MSTVLETCHRCQRPGVRRKDRAACVDCEIADIEAMRHGQIQDLVRMSSERKIWLAKTLLEGTGLEVVPAACEHDWQVAEHYNYHEGLPHDLRVKCAKCSAFADYKLEIPF